MLSSATGIVRRMQDLFPLTHGEQAGVAGRSALLSLSVLTVPQCSSEFLCSSVLMQWVCSWWFPLPFVSSQGAKKKLCENAPKLSITFFLVGCFISGQGFVCESMRAAETVLNSMLSVFQKLHDLHARRTETLHLDVFLLVLNLFVRHSCSAWLGYVLSQSMKRY